MHRWRIALWVCLGTVVIANVVNARMQQQAEVRKGTKMSKRATGPFDVKLTPNDEGAAMPVGRMTIDKQFHGDLEATSKGQMLMASSSSVQGSAGYVAIEKVTGSLNGRRGSFYLQHSGTMTRGAGELTITVIPDSGADQLVGLTGRMNIIITDGKHSYDFDYTLPDAP